jgi:DNA-binding response OmpR family regulator
MLMAVELNRRDQQVERTQMGRQHVFVVNGSPDFLDVIRELLQDELYNVTTTNFVPRTFEQIAALQPNLLVIDVVVGQRAGWDLLERLHAEASTNRIPVIVVSTTPHLLERAREQAERYAGSYLLPKPFDFDELLGSIRELIGPA